MQLRKSERKKAKIRMALQSPSGAGKTYSALLLAYGLTGNWNKVVVIDTEHNSSDLEHVWDLLLERTQSNFVLGKA